MLMGLVMFWRKNVRAAGEMEMLMEWIRSMPRIVSLVLVGSLLSLLPATAQQPSIHDETVHGRRAYVLENGKMRVSALRGGGHLAEIRFLSSDPRKAVTRSSRGRCRCCPTSARG